MYINVSQEKQRPETVLAQRNPLAQFMNSFIPFKMQAGYPPNRHKTMKGDPGISFHCLII